MSILKRALDSKNTFEGKVIAILVSVALVFSGWSITAFAEEVNGANPTKATVPVDLDATKGGSTGGSSTPDKNAPADLSKTGTPLSSGDQTVAADEALVKLTLENAYIVVREQSIETSSFKVAKGKDLTFSAVADSGFKISSVAAKNSDLGAEIDVAKLEDGTYRITADKVDSKLSVEVKAVAAKDEKPGSSESTPITSDTKVPPAEKVEGNEIEKPAVTLTATVDGTVITLNAEKGVLPKGVTMSAVPVNGDEVEKAASKQAEIEGKELVKYVAFDITLHDAEGNEIQPNGAVKVSFANTGLDESKTDILHSSGSLDKAEKIGEGASVEASHFSTFLMVETNSAKGALPTGLLGGNGTSADPYILDLGTKVSNSFLWNQDWGRNDYTVESGSNFVTLDASNGDVTGIRLTGDSVVEILHTGKLLGPFIDKNERKYFKVQIANPAKDVSIFGPESVAQFEKINLSAVFSPSGSSAEVTWESSNQSILTVDDKGVVTGLAEGSATVTMRARIGLTQTISKNKVITVTKATSGTDAQFYYLKTPTSDPISNDSSQWGNSPGDGTVNIENATWVDNWGGDTSGKNI